MEEVSKMTILEAFYIKRVYHEYAGGKKSSSTEDREKKLNKMAAKRIKKYHNIGKCPAQGQSYEQNYQMWWVWCHQSKILMWNLLT